MNNYKCVEEVANFINKHEKNAFRPNGLTGKWQTRVHTPNKGSPEEIKQILKIMGEEKDPTFMLYVKHWGDMERGFVDIWKTYQKTSRTILGEKLTELEILRHDLEATMKNIEEAKKEIVSISNDIESDNITYLKVPYNS